MQFQELSKRVSTSEDFARRSHHPGHPSLICSDAKLPTCLSGLCSNIPSLKVSLPSLPEVKEHPLHHSLSLLLCCFIFLSVISTGSVQCVSTMKAEILFYSLFYHLWFVKSQPHSRCSIMIFEWIWKCVESSGQSQRKFRMFLGCRLCTGLLLRTFTYVVFMFSLSLHDLDRKRPLFLS